MIFEGRLDDGKPFRHFNNQKSTIINRKSKAFSINRNLLGGRH
jgi:hypothetical protein